MNGPLKRLAQELGVSMSTVSRALSGKKGVSEKRRQEIMALAEKLGISLNAQASSLRSGTRQGLMLVTQALPTEITTLRNYRIIDAGKSLFGTVRIAVYQNGTDATRASRNPHRSPSSMPMLPAICSGAQKMASAQA